MNLGAQLVVDPRFEELVRAAASDPRSGLLRARSRHPVRALFISDVPPMSGTQIESAAERELLRVYRHELADLLNDVASRRLYEEKRGETLCPYVVDSQLVLHVSEGEVRERLDQLQHEREDPSSESGDALSVLESCFAEPGSRAPDVVQLIATSMRIAPTDRARSIGAWHYYLQGSPRSALQIGRYVASTSAMPRDIAYAASVASSSLAALKQFGLALSGYRAICHHQPERAYQWIFRLTCALQAGDAADANVCVNELENLAATSSEQVRWCGSMLRLRRQRGEWSPTRNAIDLARRFTGRSTLGAARICDEFV